MIHCKTLNKDLATHADMFKELKANEDKIIGIKKASILKSCERGQFTPTLNIVKKLDAEKAGMKLEDGYTYAVINTTKYLDSHDDVHFDNTFKKSVNDNKGRLYYVSDHNISIQTIIAYPKDVDAYLKMIPWSLVGKDFEGETQALIYKMLDSVMNPNYLEIIKKHGAELQNSVRMQYVKVKFAVNSKDKDYIENKAYFDSRINQIANKEQVLAQGYFYGVEEAKIITEGSLVPLGSNDATSILQNTGEPEKSTIPTEPGEPTQKVNSNLLLNLFN